MVAAWSLPGKASLLIVAAFRMTACNQKPRIKSRRAFKSLLQGCGVEFEKIHSTLGGTGKIPKSCDFGITGESAKRETVWVECLKGAPNRRQ
jgi:hypothetical protein